MVAVRVVLGARQGTGYRVHTVKHAEEQCAPPEAEAQNLGTSGAANPRRRDALATIFLPCSLPSQAHEFALGLSRI